jgi:hypothetical protein
MSVVVLLVLLYSTVRAGSRDIHGNHQMRLINLKVLQGDALTIHCVPETPRMGVNGSMQLAIYCVP